MAETCKLRLSNILKISLKKDQGATSSHDSLPFDAIAFTLFPWHFSALFFWHIYILKNEKLQFIKFTQACMTAVLYISKLHDEAFGCYLMFSIRRNFGNLKFRCMNFICPNIQDSKYTRLRFLELKYSLKSPHPPIVAVLLRQAVCLSSAVLSLQV